MFLAMTPNGVTENLRSPKSQNHVLAALRLYNKVYYI